MKKTLALVLALLLVLCSAFVLEAGAEEYSDVAWLMIYSTRIKMIIDKNEVDMNRALPFIREEVFVNNFTHTPVHVKTPYSDISAGFGINKVKVNPTPGSFANAKWYKLKVNKNEVIFNEVKGPFISQQSFAAGECPDDFRITIQSSDESDIWDDSAFIDGDYALTRNGIEWDMVTTLFGQCSLLPGRNGIELVPSEETLKLLNSLPAGSYELLLNMGSVGEETGNPQDYMIPVAFTVTSTVPATGDDTPAALYAVLGMLCLAACAALFIRRRRV